MVANSAAEEEAKEAFSCMQRGEPDSTLFDNYDEELQIGGFQNNSPRMAESTEEPTPAVKALREYHAIMTEMKESQRQQIE